MRNDPRLLPPFRRTEASDVGLTDADVRRFAANGLIIKVGRGLYAGSDLALGQSDPVAELVRAKAMLRR